MAINKDKTYLVYNYNPHTVCFTAKREHYSMPPATDEEPTAIPLTIDEIISLNTSSRVFKNGTLRFEKEYEEDIYEALRITDWRSILTNKDIENIIASPTVDNLERILKIDDAMYFNRIYGIFIGMRNAGVEISIKVENVIRERYRELRDGIRTTRIAVTPVEPRDDSAKRIRDLEDELNQMKEMLKMALGAQSKDVIESPNVDSDAVSAGAEPPKQTKKPTAKKK